MLESETKYCSKSHNPFGSVMSGRQYSTGGGYRYGFNGKEKDSDIAADNYDFGARIYDARIGRWMAVDPFAFKNPGINQYCFGLSSPLIFADGDGKDIIVKSLQAQDEIIKILGSAFGEKVSKDFSFCYLIGADGNRNFKLEFTGNISDYKRKEQKVLEPLLSVINNKDVIATVYFQKEFLESDILKIKTGGGDAVSTDQLGGEGVIAKDKPNNDYSLCNVYIDPEEFTKFSTGRIEAITEYKDDDNQWTTDPSKARALNAVQRTKIQPEVIKTYKYSKFFHAMGHVIGGKYNPGMAEDLEFLANRIHKEKNEKGKYKSLEILSRQYDLESHPSGENHKSMPNNSRPLKTLADVWDE